MVPDKESEDKLPRLACLDPPLKRFSRFRLNSSSSLALRKSTSDMLDGWLYSRSCSPTDGRSNVSSSSDERSRPLSLRYSNLDATYAAVGLDFEFADFERVSGSAISEAVGRVPSKDGREDAGDLGRSSA